MSEPTPEPTTPSAHGGLKKGFAQFFAVLTAVFGGITVLIGALFCGTALFHWGGQYGGLGIALVGLPVMVLTGLLGLIFGVVYLCMKAGTKTGTVSTTIGLVSIAVGVLLVSIPLQEAQQANTARFEETEKTVGPTTEHTVTFEVTGMTKASMYYSAASSYGPGQTQAAENQTLPWRTSMQVDLVKLSDAQYSSINVHFPDNSPTAPLTCRILVDGKVISENTSSIADGVYCTASALGSSE